MRKLSIVVLLVMFAASFAFAKLPLALEGAMGIGISNGSTAISLDGGALLDITERVKARATVLSLNLSGGSGVYIGTGVGLDGILYFPLKQMKPYGIMGLQFTSASGWSNFGLNIGGGVEFALHNSPIRPFGELVIGVLSTSYSSGGYSSSSSNTIVNIRGGIRFR